MKNYALVVLCLVLPFSMSFAESIDVEILKTINAHGCLLYDCTNDVISTNAFAMAVGLSPMFVSPKVSLISAAITGIEVYLLKDSIKRARPFEKYKWDIKRAKANGYSMPSGHAAMAFEAAYIWSEHIPGLSLLFYSMATYISISRIYYGVHYPSDILIGAIIGYSTSYVVSKTFDFTNLKQEKVSLSFKFNF